MFVFMPNYVRCTNGNKATGEFAIQGSHGSPVKFLSTPFVFPMKDAYSKSNLSSDLNNYYSKMPYIPEINFFWSAVISLSILIFLSFLYCKPSIRRMAHHQAHDGEIKKFHWPTEGSLPTSWVPAYLPRAALTWGSGTPMNTCATLRKRRQFELIASDGLQDVTSISGTAVDPSIVHQTCKEFQTFQDGLLERGEKEAEEVGVGEEEKEGEDSAWVPAGVTATRLDTSPIIDEVVKQFDEQQYSPPAFGNNVFDIEGKDIAGDEHHELEDLQDSPSFLRYQPQSAQSDEIPSERLETELLPPPPHLVLTDTRWDEEVEHDQSTEGAVTKKQRRLDLIDHGSDINERTVREALENKSTLRKLFRIGAKKKLSSTGGGENPTLRRPSRLSRFSP